MRAPLSAADVRSLLQLRPNATCGEVRQSFTSGLSTAPGALSAPFADARPLGGALYFMVTPREPVRLHRIRSDQLYHYYLGDPLELFLLHLDGSAARVVVGPDLRAGQQVQLLIPGGTFHAARLLGHGRWFLGGSTAWPAVMQGDAEIGDLEALAARFATVASELRAIAELASDAGG